MKGELGIKIKKIELRGYGDGFYEMTIYGQEDDFLHIVGDNDLKTHLEEALKNIVQK